MKKLIYWTVLLLVLMGQSCSAPYHFDKFQQKGGKVNCVTDTLIVNDTLLINGDTVIVPREHYIIKDSIHYVTKWETKYKYKTLKIEHKTSQIEAKEETKQKKQEQKTARNESDNNRKIENNLGNKVMRIFWAILFLIIGFLVLRFAINQFKKRMI